MTATGSENYVTEYSYNNAQGKYTALLQKETKTVEDDNALKLQNNVKQTVYTYDANGNQITKTADGKTETNTYDGLNQLIGFTDGETTASYTYGISGLRDSKTVNGVTTTHIWSGSQIVVDYTAHYTSTVYIRGTSLAAAFDWDEGSKSDYRFYTQNAHGDVVNLTDAEGNVTKTYTYDAFGVEVNPDSGDINVFRFCREYFDTEMGTIYLRARYYTTVSEICANTGFDAYDDNNYWSCMEYLDNRDYSNDYYEQVISEVMPIYNREVNDITNGAQLYYTPATMVPEGSTPNWDFDALEGVTIDGVDQYYEARFYKYK